jgi:hypothetical protein
MKALFWIGLVVLILGVASLVVEVPRSERHGIEVGDVELGVETQHDEKIPPVLSGILIAGGIAALIAGKRRTA